MVSSLCYYSATQVKHKLILNNLILRDAKLRDEVFKDELLEFRNQIDLFDSQIIDLLYSIKKTVEEIVRSLN